MVLLLRSAAPRVRRLAGIAAVSALWVAVPGAAPAQETERGSALRLGGMTFVTSHGQLNDVVLKAERVFLPPRSDVAQLEVVEVVMRNPDARRESFQMTCDRGDLVLASSDFRAEGNVEGVTGDGRRFYTTWVEYDSKKGIVSTQAKVRIVDGVHTMLGRGFRYNIQDGRFVLTGGATVLQE